MATNTTNYNFKKPDESDFYSIQDQNGNWDKADAALKDLDTPNFEDYSGSTAVPDAATAIGNIKSKGKLSTILSNIKAAFRGVCLIGNIVNNCVSSDTNKPLAAAQGKVLMDLYNVLNTNLRFIDWDKINVSTPDYTDASPRLKIFYVNGWDNDYAKYTPTPDIKSMWIVVHIPVRPDGGFTQQWISAGTGMVYSRVYINGQWSVFGAMLGTNTNMGTVRFSKIGVTQDSDGYHMHIYDDGNTWIAKIT